MVMMITLRFRIIMEAVRNGLGASIARSSCDRFVGERLRYYRQKAKISKDDLAKGLAVAANTIDRFETGQQRIKAAQLFILSSLLDVSVADFFQSESHAA